MSTKSVTGRDQAEIQEESWDHSVHMSNALEENPYVPSQNNKTAIVFQIGSTLSQLECFVIEANPLSSLLCVQI